MNNYISTLCWNENVRIPSLSLEDGFVDFPINSDHKSKVYYKDGSESSPDMIRVKNNGDGSFHGFPIDSKTAEPIRK